MNRFLKYFFLVLFAVSTGWAQASVSTLVREGSVRVHGVRLYYTVMGSGDPILFIHGGPGLDHSYFLPQMTELADNHTLVFFDQRASGRSGIPKDTSAMRIGQFVDDIEGIRKALRLGTVTVLGHSWGTLLALRYAIKYPDNLGSLILVSPVPANSDEQAIAARNFHLSKIDSSDLASLMKSKSFARRSPLSLDRYFRIIFRGFMYNPSDAQKIRFWFPKDYPARSRMLRYLGPDAITYDLYPRLDSLKVRTLIVTGDHDPAPLEIPTHLHNAIPDSRLIVLKQCGHFPSIEQPRNFFPAIRAFLKQQ